MKIDIKSMYVVPMVMMIVFAIHTSISFNAIESSLASYLSLAITIMSFVLALTLIIRASNISRLSLFAAFFLFLVEAVSLAIGVEWKDWIYTIVDVALLMFLFHYYSGNLHPLLTGAVIGFSLCIYAQLFQCITNPDMWLIVDEKTNVGYLLGGNYNSIGCRVLVALLTGILSLKISKWWWINLVPLIASGVTILFMVQSMTSVTCILLMILLCLLPSRNLQRLACFSILVIVVLFEVFVCFQGKGFENNDLARWFLIDILGKDMTFTNRTNMWDAALRVIGESPIWGYGYVTEKWFFSNMSSQAIGSHNFILGILINGGIIGLGLYLYTFYLALRKLIAYKDYYSNVIFIGIASLSIMMLMEYYPVQFPFYLFTLAYYYEQITEATTKPKLA